MPRRLFVGSLLIVMLSLLGACGGSSFDAAAFDPETILKQDDAPSGATLGVSNVPDEVKAKLDPAPAKTAFRDLKSGGAPMGGVTLLLYSSPSDAEKAFKGLEKADALAGVGEQSSSEIKKDGDIGSYIYVFRRCNAVVSATFVDVMVAIPNPSILTDYLKKIDGRLQESAVCTK